MREIADSNATAETRANCAAGATERASTMLALLDDSQGEARDDA